MQTSGTTYTIGGALLGAVLAIGVISGVTAINDGIEQRITEQVEERLSGQESRREYIDRMARCREDQETARDRLTAFSDALAKAEESGDAEEAARIEEAVHQYARAAFQGCE